MATPARHLDPRQERTRAAALEAAREILATEGWDGVTHLRVAERANVGRTTVWRHWPDTTALLSDAIADEATAAHIEPSGNLREDLISELEMIRFELTDRHLAPVLATLVDRAEWDENFRQIKGALVKEATSVFRVVLRAGIAAGELRRDINVERSVAELVGPVVYRRLISGSPVTPPFVTAVVDDFLSAHRSPEELRA